MAYFPKNKARVKAAKNGEFIYQDDKTPFNGTYIKTSKGGYYEGEDINYPGRVIIPTRVDVWMDAEPWGTLSAGEYPFRIGMFLANGTHRMACGIADSALVGTGTITPHWYHCPMYPSGGGGAFNYSFSTAQAWNFRGMLANKPLVFYYDETAGSAMPSSYPFADSSKGTSGAYYFRIEYIQINTSAMKANVNRSITS